MGNLETGRTCGGKWPAVLTVLISKKKKNPRRGKRKMI